MSMEVILSTAFGRVVDVQGGNQRRILESALAVIDSFAPSKENQLTGFIRMLQLVPCKLQRWSSLGIYLGIPNPFVHLRGVLEYLAKSASKIIRKRRMESDSSAIVSSHKYVVCLLLFLKMDFASIITS